MKKQIADRPFYIKLTCVLISIVLMGYLAIIGKEVLSPLLFAGLFSILLLPLARFLENRCRLPRSLASLVAVLLFLGCINFVLYLVGEQLGSLSGEWPQFKQQLNTSFNDLQQWISAKAHINLDSQMDYINTASSKFLSSGTVVLGATLSSLSSLVFFMVFTFIYSFLFLLYRRLIMRFFLAVFREENGALVREIVEQVQQIIRKYITGLLIEMAVVSTVLCIAFSLLGVRYPILLGLLAGLFNLIPYIGIFTAMGVSTLITFATAGFSKIVLVLIVLLCTHLLDSNILFPWVVGSKVRINALVMIVGVVVGGMIWGISGMFLSIPVIAVLKIISDRIESLNAWGMLFGSELKAELPAAAVLLKDPDGEGNE